MHGSSLFDGEIPLTRCELEVCYELVKTSMGLKEIAAKLGKSAKTVSVQATSAYQKLSVQSRIELESRGSIVESRSWWHSYRHVMFCTALWTDWMK